jgi:propionyl-CoA carboxylase alpha chain
MGDKLAAKELMHDAGVPVLPAVEVRRGEDLAKAATRIGFPLLVKAAAGGGGKGMRIVGAEEELEEAVRTARRESAAAFGDDSIFLERWVASVRHVEIQVLGDLHGNLVHCFERECSIQRRHQKIIEEAPSPAVSPQLREKMGVAAVSAAAAIRYSSAGTVEFLLEDDHFWFLEMNTRLQVEHPVTEAICGLDLVREQIRIAQGEALEIQQSELAIAGHAIEARLYAEDAERDFLPVTGHVLAWDPPDSPAARFDSGIEAGSSVGIEFDPMLAKVIVHAPSRREAALRLARVLAGTRVQGITTNRDFLVATLRHPVFLAGETTTDFIERVNPPRTRVPSRDELLDAAIAVAMAAQSARRSSASVLTTFPTGWRNTPMPPQEMRLRHREENIVVRYQARRDGRFAVEANDRESGVWIQASESGRTDLEIDGRRVAANVVAEGTRWLVHEVDGDLEFEEIPRFPVRETESVAGGLVAPMPGKVIAVHVEIGARVEAGQLLLVLEAMKMEHRITAPVDGVVKELRVRQGDQVANGELMVVLSEGDES